MVLYRAWVVLYTCSGVDGWYYIVGWLGDVIYCGLLCFGEFITYIQMLYVVRYP